MSAFGQKQSIDNARFPEAYQHDRAGTGHGESVRAFRSVAVCYGRYRSISSATSAEHSLLD